MDIASTEKGRAAASKIQQQRMEHAKRVRQLLAGHFRHSSFTYHEAHRHVLGQGMKISSGSFQAMWTDFKNLSVLTGRGCGPGQWRFDPDVYFDRYRQSIDCPALSESAPESVVDPSY